MTRIIPSIRKSGRLKELFYDLFCKPVGMGVLLFVDILLKRMGIPVVDKRCHLLLRAQVNVGDFLGDKGLTRWFIKTSITVFVRLFGPDNGYISRYFLVMEEYVSLKLEAEKRGEVFPNGKTDDYVEREIIKKGFGKV